MSAVEQAPDKEAGAALATNQQAQIAKAIGLRVVNTQARQAVEDTDRHYKPEEADDE